MYVPTLALVVLAFWWLVIRPANLAAREREEQRRREQERAREAEKKKEALAELETFHWKKQLMSGQMLVSVDVHFPTMRMCIETASRYSRDESTDYEVRRKPDGTWEYRLTSQMQSRDLEFLRELLPKAERFESLSEEQRANEPGPFEITHGLVANDTVAAVVEAIERTSANEWMPFVSEELREVMPQVEFQYAKLMKSL